ncbi:MAG: AI-2E family transporter [Ruminococcaceae bacterium]|nr:AI-2E family transporter [Oscillospiraceae bacterium]
MDRQKLKNSIHIVIIIFLALALAITYFFLFFGWDAIAQAISTVLGVLRPIIIGIIIAYLLKPTCNGYEKLLLKKLIKSQKRSEFKSRKIANVIAVILTYVTWTVILAGILWIVLPQIIESISKFITDAIAYAPGYIDSITAWIANFKLENPDMAPYLDMAWTGILDWLKNVMVPKLPEIGNSLILGVIDLIGIVVDVAIGIVVSVFFLAGRKVFATKLKLLVHAVFKENHAKAIISEFRFADRMFGGFLEGKIIDSAIIGIIHFIAFELMGIHYSGLLAVICGVTNIIPFFGPFIGAAPTAVIILMAHSDEPIKLLYYLIFVCVIQFLDGNILDPHIVGGNIKISPFCVIFAVLFFGGLWGFAGMIFGVPLFAVIYDIVKKLMKHRYKKIGKFDMYKENLDKLKDPDSKPAPAAATANAACDTAFENTDAPSQSEQNDASENTDKTEQ